MSSLPKHYITLDEYFELDAKAEVKSEYYAGEMYAMSGGTHDHAGLAGNLMVALRPYMRAHKCRSFTSDLRVKAGDLYTYPDLIFVCGELEIGKSATLLNPTALFEIISPSSAVYDRTKKFDCYREIASLHYYGLVEQDRMRTEVYTRTGSGWVLSVASGESGTLEIRDLGISIPLTELYEDIHLPPSQPLHPALE